MAQKYFSIKMKFLVLYALAMLISVAVIITLFIYVRGQMYDVALSKNAEIMTVFSAGVENELTSINSAVDNFFTHDAVRNGLIKIKAGLADYDGYQSYKQIDSLLVTQNVVNDIIEGVSCQLDGIPSIAFGYKTPPISVAEQAESGALRYYKLEDDTEYIYGTKKMDDGKMTLVICLNLQRLMRRAYSIYGEQFDSRFMIVKDSEVLYCADSALQTLLPDASVENMKNRGTQFAVFRGERYIIHYIYSSQSDWYYYNIVQEKELFERINFTVTCALLFTVLLFLLLALLVYIITGKITYRLKILSGRLRGIEKGIYEQLISTGRPSRLPDETDSLIAYYNSMVTKIHELIDIDMKREILLHKAKYQSLKAQINPHFLYNTLETAKSLALTDRGGDAADVLGDLSKLLRACLSLPEFITLEQELDLIAYYVRIQKVRYGERLQFKTEIPENIGQIQIPCMLIQPLVENSIKYALESMLEPCRILLSASIEQDWIILSVQDNGPGFPANAISHKDGIGLQYIRDRLRLEYGEGASLKVENLDEGSVVRIMILRKGERSGV